MEAQLTFSTGKNDLVISVPVELRRKSGRKYIIMPEGEAQMSLEAESDDYIFKALVRAYHWNDMLDSGKVGSIAELAKNERIADTYMARILRLTLLAPDIKKAIIDGRHPKTLRLADLFKTFPLIWAEQRKWFGFPAINAA